MNRTRSPLNRALWLALFLWVGATLARLAFAAAFSPPGTAWSDLTGALLLGARYDLRWAMLSVLPLWAISRVPLAGRRLVSPRARWFWLAFWMGVSLAWVLAWVVDAGHYAYLHQRLSAVIVSLAGDPREAAGMVWQTYPVLWITSGVLLWLGLCRGVFGVLWPASVVPDRWSPRTPRWRVVSTELLVAMLALLAVHGRLSQYPLRWSDAGELSNAFGQQLALNPMQNLYDTWSFRTQQFNAAAMRTDASEVRRFVGLPPLQADEPISFLRSVSPRPGARPMNVVVVLLESFAAHKTGSLGSPLGATPSFDALAADGLLFTRMMSAHAHTARGVFATVTGLPDVSSPSTASRNPAATQQQSIVNEFKDHAKFYFIGGSTSWANVRGVLTASIDGIDIYEEGRLKSPSEDVWGVSDKNLLQEANAVFRAQAKPFFAIVQTSGNHRPYTIPAEDRAMFKPRTPTPAELQAHGFSSQQEYEAFAYLDWCIGQFMQQARREAYFDNTLFAFIGDHGIIGPTGPHLPPAWHDLAITQGHTPFLVYAPKHVPARRIDHWAQQVDVLPTVASLAGIGYRNTTLGRDLLDPRFDDSRVAFAFQFAGPGQRGLLVGDRLLLDQPPAAQAVFDITAADPKRNLLDTTPVPTDLAALQRRWGHFAQAYANTALYLQTHNRRLAAGGGPRD